MKHECRTFESNLLTLKLKSYLKEFVADKLGYYIYNIDALPVGTNLRYDLLYKIQLNPKVIFDVGANIGQTVEFYRQIYPEAHIYSFEPVPSTFAELHRNVSHYKKVTCFNIAFGEKEEDLEIQIVANENSVTNSINPLFQKNLNCSDVKHDSAQIKVKRLDDFVRDNKINHIDLLKIDTENFEIPVLKGANETLESRKVSAIICEAGFLKSNSRNSYFAEVNEILESKGFALFGIYEMGHLGFKNGVHYGNLLYISKEYRETRYRNWQFGYR